MEVNGPMKPWHSWQERWLRRGVGWQIAMQHRQDDRLAAADPDDPEAGSTTVEYAIGAIATAGFAALLLAVLKSGGVKAMITNVIQTALSI